jgi:hypothetical protein
MVHEKGLGDQKSWHKARNKYKNEGYGKAEECGNRCEA